jgi:hypothetical protein
LLRVLLKDRGWSLQSHWNTLRIIQTATNIQQERPPKREAALCYLYL